MHIFIGPLAFGIQILDAGEILGKCSCCKLQQLNFPQKPFFRRFIFVPLLLDYLCKVDGNSIRIGRGCITCMSTFMLTQEYFIY